MKAMKIPNHIIRILFAMLFLCSCDIHVKPLKELLPGSYVGVAPCSNCRGVYTKVIFCEDGTARFTTDAEDENALRGRRGQWIVQDSIIMVDASRDTFYFRQVSSCEIKAIYIDRNNPLRSVDGYSLYKDTIRSRQHSNKNLFRLK